MHITATVGTDNVGQINLYYSNEFVGKFSSVIMYDDSNHNDGSEGDGVYGAAIPGQSEGTYVRYYIEALAADVYNTASYLPIGAEHHCYIYKVRYNEISTSELVINELMASNDATIADAFGEFDDWIELYNNSSSEISLDGYYLTDDITDLTQFPLPTIVLVPDSYTLIWADKDEEQGVDHANFKLDADGEEVFLVNSNLEIVDQLSFSALVADQSYSRSPNGTGNFTIAEATPLENNDGMPTATINLADTQSITLYPNPAHDVLNITLSNTELTTIEAFSITGVQMFSKKTDSELFSINTSNWKSGSYIILINNNAYKIEVK